MPPHIDFIETYKEFHSSLTDASLKYAQALSMVLMGNACGRNSFVNITPSPVYLNFFLLILGESTLSRKTTALEKIAQTIVREDDILPNNYSPESLYDCYAKNPHRILIETEFTKILKKAKRKNSFMSHIVEDFEQIYDCPNSFKSDTRGHKEVIARNLFLTITAATTPAALQESLTEEMLFGGFYPRFLIVWEKHPVPRERQDIPPGTEQKRLVLETFLKKTRVSTYEFDFQPKRALQEWQNGIIRQDPEATSIIGRYEGYIIKISSVIALNNYIRQNGFQPEVNAAAETGQLDHYIEEIVEKQKTGECYRPFDPIEIRVTHDDFCKARDFVQGVLDDSRELRSLISEEKILSKLFGVMRGLEKVRHSDFLRKTGLTARQFKEGIETLVDTRKICKLPEDDIMWYCIASRERCRDCHVSNQSSEVVAHLPGHESDA
jgi:hypothetical protein